MLGRQRILELLGLSLLGSLGTILVARLLQSDEKTTNEPWERVESFSDAVVALPTMEHLGRYWKIAAALGVLLVMEACKEVGQHGMGAQQLLRVLTLKSFREALRNFAQGKGLPHELSAEEQAEAEAVAAAEYANRRVEEKKKAAAQ
jgi:hypothetical protein